MASQTPPPVDPHQYAHAKAGWVFFTKALTVSTVAAAIVTALVVGLLAY